MNELTTNSQAERVIHAPDKVMLESSDGVVGDAGGCGCARLYVVPHGEATTTETSTSRRISVLTNTSHIENPGTPQSSRHA